MISLYQLMPFASQPAIIAELSANHRQDEAKAHQLVEAAAASGATAVKVQTYTPDTITFRSDADPFVIRDQKLWKGQSLWNLYASAATPWEWQPALQNKARDLGLQFVASVFDFSSVDFWERHGLGIYKIASAEIVDIPLLKYIAATGKPMIISTGMAKLHEVREAVDTVFSVKSDIELTLLKCSSAYPSSPSDMNLNGIQTLKQEFGLPVGLSDHSLDDAVAHTAVGLGAVVFEKHLKLNASEKTPDDAFSLDPEAFRRWADGIRRAWSTLGESTLLPTDAEQGTLPFRKSLFIVRDLEAGDRLSPDNLRSIRPASGLHPREYDRVLGKCVKIPVKAGTPLSWEMMEE